MMIKENGAVLHGTDNPRAALRGADVRKVFEGERRKLVSVCGWCPDVEEQTAAARAHGFDVTHGICAACAIRWKVEGAR